jgi:uncharacterized protein YqeY
MALVDQIKQDQVQAQKERQELKLGTLRLLLAEIHNREIDKHEQLSDEEVVRVIKGQVKKRQEAIELYKKGNRPELAEKEEREMKLLKQYLPEEMGSEELEKVVEKVINDIGGKEGANFGQVMGAVMKEVGGKAEGKLVAETVKRALG